MKPPFHPRKSSLNLLLGILLLGCLHCHVPTSSHPAQDAALTASLQLTLNPEAADVHSMRLISRCVGSLLDSPGSTLSLTWPEMPGKVSQAEFSPACGGSLALELERLEQVLPSQTLGLTLRQNSAGTSEIDAPLPLFVDGEDLSSSLDPLPQPEVRTLGAMPGQLVVGSAGGFALLSPAGEPAPLPGWLRDARALAPRTVAFQDSRAWIGGSGGPCLLSSSGARGCWPQAGLTMVRSILPLPGTSIPCAWVLLEQEGSLVRLWESADRLYSEPLPVSGGAGAKGIALLRDLDGVTRLWAVRENQLHWWNLEPAAQGQCPAPVSEGSLTLPAPSDTGARSLDGPAILAGKLEVEGGVLWIGRGMVLYQVTLAQGETQANPVLVLPSPITALLQDEQQLWIGTSAGLYRRFLGISTETQALESVPMPEPVGNPGEVAPTQPFVSALQLLAEAESGTRGNRLFVGHRQGLILCELAGRSLPQCRPLEHQAPGLAQATISASHRDSAGTLWLGDDRGALYAVAPNPSRQGMLQAQRCGSLTPPGRTHSEVLQIRDRDDWLWIASATSLYRLKLVPPAQGRMDPCPSELRSGLPSPVVAVGIRGIELDPLGNTWILATGAGQRALKLHRLNVAPTRPLGPALKAEVNDLRFLAGHQWLATDRGLECWTGPQYDKACSSQVLEALKTIPEGVTRLMAPHGSTKLYAITTSARLFELSPGPPLGIHELRGAPLLEAPLSIRDLELDSKGNRWVLVAADNGVSASEYPSRAWVLTPDEQWLGPVRLENGLDPNARSMALDPRGGLWIGRSVTRYSPITSTGGLAGCNAQEIERLARGMTVGGALMLLAWMGLIFWRREALFGTKSPRGLRGVVASGIRWLIYLFSVIQSLLWFSGAESPWYPRQLRSWFDVLALPLLLLLFWLLSQRVLRGLSWKIQVPVLSLTALSVLGWSMVRVMLGSSAPLGWMPDSFQCFQKLVIPHGGVLMLEGVAWLVLMVPTALGFLARNPAPAPESPSTPPIEPGSGGPGPVGPGPVGPGPVGPGPVDSGPAVSGPAAASATASSSSSGAPVPTMGVSLDPYQYLKDELKRALRDQKLVVLVGAGVSIGATGGARAASWRGLLELGAERCLQLHPELGARWLERVKEDIHQGEMADLMAATHKIAEKLGAPKGGDFHQWLEDTVGKLELRDNRVLEALKELGAPLLTTNYDDMLERGTGLRPVTWKQKALLLKVLSAERPAIGHLHGHWEDPESVILDVKSYARVVGDEFVQTLLKSLLLNHRVLFVGFGAGLGDDNFGPLLEWARGVLRQSPHHHFLLAKNSDVDALQRAHPAEERIKVLPIGASLDELALYLRSLK